MKTLITALIVLGSSACHLPNPSPPMQRAEGDPITPTPEATVKHDQGLVPADAPGTIRIVQEPLREVEGVSGGKVWLLELYQGALAEKEVLARSLEVSERGRFESQASLVAMTAANDELTTRSTDLEGRVRLLEAQSLDLARRLAESEIARLEGQKAELERAADNDRKERP